MQNASIEIGKYKVGTKVWYYDSLRSCYLLVTIKDNVIKRGNYYLGYTVTAYSETYGKSYDIAAVPESSLMYTKPYNVVDICKVG
jgi:hypothetical protein